MYSGKSEKIMLYLFFLYLQERRCQGRAIAFWNAKQFTCEMETAFQQMWQRYVEVDKQPGLRIRDKVGD